MEYRLVSMQYIRDPTSNPGCDSIKYLFCLLPNEWIGAVALQLSWNCCISTMLKFNWLTVYLSYIINTFDTKTVHGVNKELTYRSIRNRKTENPWLPVPYSIKASCFCELGRQKRQSYEPCSSQKWFAFVEYGTRCQEFSVFLYIV